MKIFNSVCHRRACNEVTNKLSLVFGVGNLLLFTIFFSKRCNKTNIKISNAAITAMSVMKNNNQLAKLRLVTGTSDFHADN